ncbi:MAG: hypothetical protein ACOZAR_00405 [Patescibacteria group bacterium]
MSPVENNNDDTKSFKELLEEAQKNQVTRIDFQSEAMNPKLEESEHRFDTAIQEAAKRYGVNVDSMNTSVPIGTLGEQEKYKNMPKNEYIQKKVDYVTKLEGLDETTKNKVLESMKTMPVENLNGFVYGLDQNLKAVKGGKLTVDKLAGKIDLGMKVCSKNFTQTLNNIEQQVGTDFVKNNSKLFEVGFVGVGMDSKEFVKKMETELAKAYPDKNQRYWVEKTLLNAHGIDHPDPAPKPVVTPAPVVASYPTSGVGNSNINYVNNVSSLTAGGGSDIKSTEKKEEKVVAAASATVGKSSNEEGEKEKLNENKLSDAEKQIIAGQLKTLKEMRKGKILEINTLESKISTHESAMEGYRCKEGANSFDPGFCSRMQNLVSQEKAQLDQLKGESSRIMGRIIELTSKL